MQQGPGDSYLGTVSDTLLTRGMGPTGTMGGVLSSKQYAREELGGLNEIQVSCIHYGFFQGGRGGGTFTPPWKSPQMAH